MSLDAPREECGVFAVVAPGRDVARLTYFALHAMQHRGQESAGMAVSDGRGVTVVRELGLVASVFDEHTLLSLTGERAIGHVRYSTTGANKWDNAQPVARAHDRGLVALGHNGNLTNTDALRDELAAGAVELSATTDSELIAAVLSAEEGTLAEAAKRAMRRLVGAYSVVVTTETETVAFRDPHGVRPLALGRIGDGWCVASETCAFEQIGATYERDVRPGELVVLTEDGIESIQALPGEGSRLCVFEQIYFARPDSVLDGGTVWQSRRRMGAELAKEWPADVDLVVGLPDSGTPAAIGFAAESGAGYSEAVVRNRYVGRSFIQPDQSLRAHGVRLKFSPLEDVIAGKRLLVVDDSIVRGTTMGQVVAMLKDVGATEVHLRISSPPILWPCYYGIDMADRDELIAANHTVEEIAEMTGADSLAYLSLEGLSRALGAPSDGHCRACLTGEYPIALPPNADKLRLETACESLGS
jgi:amidophosphoribosyltransferase